MTLSTEVVVAIISLLVTSVPGFWIVYHVRIIKGHRRGRIQQRRRQTETPMPLLQDVCDSCFDFGFLSTHSLLLSISAAEWVLYAPYGGKAT